MKAEELKSKVVPVLLSGTRRDAGNDILALGEDRMRSVLNGLSLAAQALRLTRPPVPSEFAAERWPHEERRIVSSRLRPAILHLLDRSTDDTARAVALALENLKLRPHPFDLPKLDGFVRRYADRLGPTAQFWVQREAPAQQMHGYFEVDDLTAENWTEGGLRQRVQFLKAVRKRDAEGALKLLEASWPSENPESRIQLLSTFGRGLSQRDKPFLEKIQKDRAPRVRALVHSFLAVLSGGSDDNPALAACMERIETSKAGLLNRKLALKLDLPSTVKEHEVNRWIQEQFADVTLRQLAAAFENTEKELIGSAANDSNLSFALALIASREKKFDLLDAITEKFPDTWGRMSELGWEEGFEKDPEELNTWTSALIKPKKWVPLIPFPAWSWLHRQMEGPLPANIMREVLASKAWTEQLEPEKKGGAEFVQVMCALCSAELRELMRLQIEPLEIDRKEKGWMLLDILDELERSK